jgi:hypothetical protein
MSPSTSNIFQSQSTTKKGRKRKKKANTALSSHHMATEEARTVKASVQSSVDHGQKLQQQPPDIAEGVQSSRGVSNPIIAAVQSSVQKLQQQPVEILQQQSIDIAECPPSNVATQAAIGDSTMSTPLPRLIYTMHPDCPPSNVTTEVASVLTPVAASALCTLSRTSSTNNTSQLHSISALQQDDNNMLLDDLLDGDEGDLLPSSENITSTPSDWDNVSPNQVMARLKLLKTEVLDQHGLCPFYKSYSNWEKMSLDKQNKAVAWFHKLPEPLKSKACCSYLHK